MLPEVHTRGMWRISEQNLSTACRPSAPEAAPAYPALADAPYILDVGAGTILGAPIAQGAQPPVVPPTAAPPVAPTGAPGGGDALAPERDPGASTCTTSRLRTPWVSRLRIGCSERTTRTK